MNIVNSAGLFRSRCPRLPALFLVLSLSSGCEGETGQAQSADPPATSSAAAQPQDAFDLRALGVDEGSVMTSAIGIVDFSDFGCIYCADFHSDDYPALYEEFVVTGEVLWKYIPISIGGFPNGDLAGVAGTCADEIGSNIAFAEMRDHLFAQREEWLAANPSLARELFISYAETLELDLESFTACIDGDQAAERLKRNNDMAMQVGVTATPTFIVQGNPVRGAPPLADFQNVLRRMIAEFRGEAPPETPADAGAPGA